MRSITLNIEDRIQLLETLGDFDSRQGDWLSAYQYYKEAIDAVNGTFREQDSEYGRRFEIATSSELYSKAAFCLVSLGDYEAAFLILDEGKARLLASALAAEQLDLVQMPEDVKAPIHARQRLIWKLDAESRSPGDAPLFTIK